MNDDVSRTLLRILDRLDKIEEILNSRDEKETFITHDPWLYPSDSEPQPYIQDYLGGSSTCGKCGMLFTGATSYYCSNNDCPVFFNSHCKVVNSNGWYTGRASRENMSNPGNKDYDI